MPLNKQLAGKNRLDRPPVEDESLLFPDPETVKDLLHDFRLQVESCVWIFLSSLSEEQQKEIYLVAKNWLK